MGSSKSKIPIEPPDQKLKFTGIPEFDTFYSQLEPIVKILYFHKANLDLSTTKLIQSLYLQSHWELNPNIETLFQVILTILSVAGKGDLRSVASFSSAPPYIKPLPNSLKRDFSIVLDCFDFLVKSTTLIGESLQKIKVSKNNILVSAKIQYEIAQKTIDQGYTMNEKVEALKNVNYNHKIVQEIPFIYSGLLNFSIKFREKIVKVLKEAQVSPLCDILIVRSIQSIAGNQKSVKKIIENFWQIN